MKYYSYKVKLTHDKGYSYLTTCAINEKTAISNICKAENCPKSAVEIISVQKCEVI